MKRKRYLRYKKRKTRPAVIKQQLLRKEAQKRAKYPIRAVYLHTAVLPQTRNRGV